MGRQNNVYLTIRRDSILLAMAIHSGEYRMRDWITTLGKLLFIIMIMIGPLIMATVLLGLIQ